MEFLNVPLPQSILKEEGKGNFEKALKIVNLLLKKELPAMLRKRLEYESERVYRLLEDYPFAEKEAKKKLYLVDISDEKFEKLLDKKYRLHNC